MRKRWLIFALLAAPCFAQSIPSQFTGLITGSSFTASISGTVMNVTAVAYGTIQVGQQISGPNIGYASDAATTQQRFTRAQFQRTEFHK